MPMAWTTMAASMMRMEGMFSSAVRPLNSGLSSSAQESIGRPIRSGRMPSVSALYTVGISDMYCVGAAANFLYFSPSREITFLGAVPCSPTALPATMPVVNSVVILSAFLMRRLSMPLRLPVGTIFLSEKNSVSIRSKLFGAVTARLLTSSVVTATYWMAMPVSAWNLWAFALSWFTAVPRYHNTIFYSA